MGCVVVLIGVGVALGIAFGGWGVLGMGLLLGYLTVLNTVFGLSPGAMENRPSESYALSKFWTATLLGTLAALIAWLVN